MNYTIRTLTKNEIDDCLKLYKESGEGALGIPFKRSFYAIIDTESFYGAFDDEKLIGTIGWYQLKRSKAYYITKLCVDNQYKGNGVGSLLLGYAMGKIVTDFKNSPHIFDFPDIYAEAVVGANNNSFYEKFGKIAYTKHCKTRDLYIYKFGEGEV